MLKQLLDWLVLQLSENKWNGLKNVLKVCGCIVLNNCKQSSAGVTFCSPQVVCQVKPSGGL